MSDWEGTSLEECLGDLPDPRVVGRCDHKLIDIVLIAVCAVICGAESWAGVETFAKAKQGWLAQFLELPLYEPVIVWIYSCEFSSPVN